MRGAEGSGGNALLGRERRVGKKGLGLGLTYS